MGHELVRGGPPGVCGPEPEGGGASWVRKQCRSHENHIPVYVVTGAGENIVSAANNAEWYAQNIPGAQLKIFPGNVGHFVFGSDCTPAGVKALFVCQDAEGVSRAEVHWETERLALQFFERNLGMH